MLFLQGSTELRTRGVCEALRVTENKEVNMFFGEITTTLVVAQAVAPAADGKGVIYAVIVGCILFAVVARIIERGGFD